MKAQRQIEATLVGSMDLTQLAKPSPLHPSRYRQPRQWRNGRNSVYLLGPHPWHGGWRHPSHGGSGQRRGCRQRREWGCSGQVEDGGAAGTPLHVEDGGAAGTPLHVEDGGAARNPRHVEDGGAAGSRAMGWRRGQRRGGVGGDGVAAGPRIGDGGAVESGAMGWRRHVGVETIPSDSIAFVWNPTGPRIRAWSNSMFQFRVKRLTSRIQLISA
jgi:hypothetical protein